MKINADYNKVHALKDGLSNLPSDKPAELTTEAVGILLQILVAAEGDIFPSQAEIDKHGTNISLLENLDPAQNVIRWKSVTEDIKAFENKYC